MKSQPVLVVMAAGMGSRYGGLKQIDPVGPNGQIILDYSIYDAYKAGFRKVVFIIRPELEAVFEETIGVRAAKLMEVAYVHQTVSSLPAGLSLPAARTKPLGTGHAVWCAAPEIDAPFAVINADDFYGADGFQQIFNFLQNTQDDDKLRCCMVGYRLENTLTENGSVARGVCRADEQGFLTDIHERLGLARGQDGVIRDEDGRVFAEGTPVSLNLWGFTPSFLSALTEMLTGFIKNELPENPEKKEFFLPFAVDALIREGKATAALLPTSARWYGVTYREDKPVIESAIAEITAQGVYPAAF